MTKNSVTMVQVHKSQLRENEDNKIVFFFLKEDNKIVNTLIKIVNTLIKIKINDAFKSFYYPEENGITYHL